MKTTHSLVALLLSTLAFLNGCESFVQDVDPPISSTEDTQLNSEDQVPFFVTGIKVRFDGVLGNITVAADDLSDAFYFDFAVPGATYTQFAEIDAGDIPLNNAVDENLIRSLGQLRLYADTLVTRASKLTFKDASLKTSALYNGYLYGGISRYFWASYYGLEPTVGGGVINNSALIPSSEMYTLAIEKLRKAIEYASTPYETAVVNSLIARCYLYNGDYANAAATAQQGMTQGAEPFGGLYNATAPNEWWLDAGRGRTQVVAEWRFADYIAQDPAEANRLAIEAVPDDTGGVLAWMQTKYPENAAAQSFMTWQENELMLAELALRNNDAAAGLTHINAVRASHQLSGLTAATLDTLYIERDKELFATGTRLIDQRRFDRWHLGPDTWQYLPITEAERNVNPNLK